MASLWGAKKTTINVEQRAVIADHHKMRIMPTPA